MPPKTKKIFIKILIIMGKTALTGLVYGLAYGLVAKVWRL